MRSAEAYSRTQAGAPHRVELHAALKVSSAALCVLTSIVETAPDDWRQKAAEFRETLHTLTPISTPSPRPTSPPKVKRTHEGSAPKVDAYLTFQVLPDSISTADFAESRRLHNLRVNPNQKTVIDTRRTAVLDRIRIKLGPGRCTIYKGLRSRKIITGLAENITDDYLVLVIQRPRGHDAIAISPIAGKHATFIVRHDTSEFDWRTVFAASKVNAKAFDARRLLFKESKYFDEYKSMELKTDAYLRCSPADWDGRLAFSAEKARCELRGQ